MKKKPDENDFNGVAVTLYYVTALPYQSGNIATEYKVLRAA